MSKIVIIGLGSGGFAASLAIRRTDPEALITIIEKRPYEMFSPCGMPFAIEGIVGLDKLRFSLPEDKQISKLLGHEAMAINPVEKNVAVKNLKTGENISVPYDSLIFAPGAEPFIPPIKGAKEALDKGVFVLHDIESARKIIEHCGKARRAAVVGAGPIGLEIAVALRAKGLDVTVIEMLSYALPRALDRDMAKLVEDSLNERGIKLLMNKSVSSINGAPVESVSVGDDVIVADMVVLASGVRANLEMAKMAGIEIGKWGIRTNARMETNIKDIYAVGDCIETVSLINHRPTVMQLSSAAYRQGMVAGTNAAGGYDIYEGALGTYVALIGSLEVGATGFNEFFAESAGFKVISGKAHGKTKPEYYPGSRDITVKIIADAKTGRVLGGQVVGEEGAGARINVLSLAIKAGMDVYSLSKTEMAYCPMVAENYDVLNKAADFAVRKLEKGK
ncbi:MAG: FAD-dependent oxidoreductase [Candidatus Methanoperedens sp.]|nr:FAD-dependent oxidoreductase [Candidatus Methanoperedens sp.]MCZ7406530.1 FAD-dependent oxidoreductase [Candidatus Methanoperedens sp.]